MKRILDSQKKGTYYPLNNPDRISNAELLMKRRIPYSLVEGVTPALIKSIDGNTIYTEHMRIGLTNNRLIYGGDIVTLTAGFEFEFGESGIVIQQKESEKKQIAYIQQRYQRILKSEKLNTFGRSTINNAVKHINDLLLETKLNSFFKQLPNDLQTDLSMLYDYNGLKYKPSSISTVISEARNKIAHGDLQYKVSLEVLVAFLTLEIMLYFIQLKRLGLNDDNNYRCVKELFCL